MSAPISRRNFLRGKISPHIEVLRPPWALVENDFLTACTRCGDCVRACPTKIITAPDAGYPAIDFNAGECTFCTACVAACTTGALQRNAGQQAWSVRARIAELCLARQRVECRICGDLCAAGAIRFPPRLGGIAAPQLDQERCNGCGACIASCPTQAITIG